MTKEITKAIILQEIQDKLKLREFESENFLFSETVVPVYNIEQHLQAWVSTYFLRSITGTGESLFYTVPENRRYFLSRYDVVFMGAGAYTVAGAYIKRVGAELVYLDLTAAQSASYHVALPMLAVLNPGDMLCVNIDGYTSTQNLRVYVDWIKEDIR